ncbi:unnamed protein product [Brassica oleracea]
MDKGKTTSKKRKESDSPTQSPKSKRKLPTRSLACNVFTRLEDDDSRCSCNDCGKTYSCNPATGGTTNLNAHMKKCKAYMDHVESGSRNVILTVGGTSDNSGKVVGMTKPFDQVAYWLRASLRSEAMRSLDLLEEENKFMDSLEEELNPHGNEVHTSS